MRPVVAEVEDVHELLPGGQLRQRQPVPVDQLLVVEPFRVGFADAGAIGEFELLQMRWSQRANASSMALANCMKVCRRAAAKILPGRGHS